MFDNEKLMAALTAYKQYFPLHWKDEKYKWEAVQYFQNNWDIEAENFLDMFMKATDKTFNLLASMNNYPRAMIRAFAEEEPETVRDMFIVLYDETRNLDERIEKFEMMAEDLRVRYDDGSWKHHYQSANAISTYLWLRYPDKYFIYKYSEVRATAKELCSDFVPKKGSGVANIAGGFKFYNGIRAVIAKDDELDTMLKNALEQNCYPDFTKTTMTVDVGFFISRFYKQDRPVELESLHSDAKFSKWYAPVIETLYKMGGSGRRSEVHQKIIEDYGITDEELSTVNTTGSPQVLNDIDWARNYLVYEDLVDNSESGIWSLTDLGKEIIITEELAGKITAKWIKIKTAEQQHRYVPDIDLSSYYRYREVQEQIINHLYTKEDFLEEVYISEEKYEVLTALLRYNKNLILQGAPGVGKTFAAKRLAYSIMGEMDAPRVELVQFHQNYSYEDFVMGYRPDGNGFKLTEGIFYKFCRKAAEDPEKDYFFIIDEINRGNMSRIFGELLMLIEKDYRGTSVRLAYNGENFSVPQNVYLIGMMNTADRSLAMIDYALRRRFKFVEMEPGFYSDGFKAYQESLHNETFDALIDMVIDLNREIKKDDSLGNGFCIGHSYFCGQDECTEEWMKAVVYYDIIPMLQEYWFDDRQKVQHWENLLSGVFDD